MSCVSAHAQSSKSVEVKALNWALSQVVRQQHHLAEGEVQRLYRVLHVYSLGFHQAVSQLTSKAQAQHKLLPAVWKAFLQLWEETLQVVLQLLRYLSNNKSLLFCMTRKCKNPTLAAFPQTACHHVSCMLVGVGCISRKP